MIRNPTATQARMSNALPMEAARYSTVGRHSCGGSSARLSASRMTVTSMTAHAARACGVLLKVLTAGSGSSQTVPLRLEQATPSASTSIGMLPADRSDNVTRPPQGRFPHAMPSWPIRSLAAEDPSTEGGWDPERRREGQPGSWATSGPRTSGRQRTTTVTHGLPSPLVNSPASHPSRSSRGSIRFHTAEATGRETLPTSLRPPSAGTDTSPH
jgi:hypothetical protein